MKIKHIDPPREFEVGFREPIVLKDCARIELAAEEQVTFAAPSGSEYDVVRKSWGYYATPSTNGRLKRFGLRTALVRSRGLVYVMLVENDREHEFRDYLAIEEQELICWLDDNDALEAIAECMQGAAKG